MREPWNEQDRTALRHYLAGNPKFKEQLAESLAKSEGDTLEKRAISGAERAGGEKMIAEINNLSEPTPQRLTDPAFLDTTTK